MKKALEYLDLSKKYVILDVGGRGLKGDRSYKSVFENNIVSYHIADIQKGENVTHVMPAPYVIPSNENYYDIIVSGQTLEHVKNPFRLVAEMKRVLKPNGYLILIAPSTGHRHDSIDCWRFMDDSFKGIAEEIGLTIIADWIDTNSVKWNDHVFIGQK